MRLNLLLPSQKWKRNLKQSATPATAKPVEVKPETITNEAKPEAKPVTAASKVSTKKHDEGKKGEHKTALDL